VTSTWTRCCPGGRDPTRRERSDSGGRDPTDSGGRDPTDVDAKCAKSGRRLRADSSARDGRPSRSRQRPGPQTVPDAPGEGGLGVLFPPGTWRTHREFDSEFQHLSVNVGRIARDRSVAEPLWASPWGASFGGASSRPCRSTGAPAAQLDQEARRSNTTSGAKNKGCAGNR
jgi:hypothetical protein